MTLGYTLGIGCHFTEMITYYEVDMGVIQCDINLKAVLAKQSWQFDQISLRKF